MRGAWRAGIPPGCVSRGDGDPVVSLVPRSTTDWEAFGFTSSLVAGYFTKPPRSAIAPIAIPQRGK